MGEAQEFDRRPRFVVITKLQDPFNHYNHPDYYNSFRDDFEYPYIYITNRCPLTEPEREASAIYKDTIEDMGFKLEPEALAIYERTLQLKFRSDRKVDEATVQGMREYSSSHAIKLVEQAKSDQVKIITKAHAQRALKYQTDE